MRQTRTRRAREFANSSKHWEFGCTSVRLPEEGRTFGSGVLPGVTLRVPMVSCQASVGSKTAGRKTGGSRRMGAFGPHNVQTGSRSMVSMTLVQAV